MKNSTPLTEHRPSDPYQDLFPLSRPAPSSRHPRMPAADRAKIFSPFSALRGYEEEIQKENKRLCRVSRRLLSEEDTDRISRLLSHIQKRETVTVRFFLEESGTYEHVTGMVAEIDYVSCYLDVSDGRKTFHIPFVNLEALSR